ncbi:hypothetical protein MJH12_12235, partial [bacterium]|nr:hypothetical protein [bacterium]
KKLGLIFNPNKRFDWMQTHAQAPLVLFLNEDLYRVYFACRDESQRSQIAYIEFDINCPKEILKISETPVLRFGKMGYFDEHGVYPSSIVKMDNKLYMYYIGWSKGAVPPMFYASIGLAISEDGGKTFEKYSEAPIMSRSKYDPWMVTAPFVFKDQDVFRMYYVSGLDWKPNSKGILTSKYLIKYAESHNGIDWKRDGHIAIGFKEESETNLAKSFILKKDGNYQAWFSYINDSPYEIGYAESKNGKDFIRKDHEIVFSGDAGDFDNKMMCYPYLFSHNDKTYMLYNGNQFGYEGFALAVLE